MNGSKTPTTAPTAATAAACGSARSAGGYAGPLRPRPAPAAAGHLAVREDQLRRPHQTDQASILRFIEDNWGTGRIGDASADAWAGSMRGLFAFDESQAPQVILDETNGTVTSVQPQDH